MSDLAQQVMTEQEARRLTERIRLTALNYTEAKAKLLQLVQEAKEGSAHEALGYSSWTDYLADTLGDEPMRVARSERPELAQVLSEEGMPNTVIAKTLGVSDMTVGRDLSAMSTNVETANPRTVTKTDGKQYTIQPRTEPEPAASPRPKRRPLKDSVDDAGWNLRRAVERLSRVAEDDRFESQKEEMATRLRSHLMNAVEVCQDLLDSITPEGDI